MRYLLMIIEASNGMLATHVVTVNEALRPALQAVIPSSHPITVFGPGSVCGLAADEYAQTLDPLKLLKRRSTDKS